MYMYVDLAHVFVCVCAWKRREMWVILSMLSDLLVFNNHGEAGSDGKEMKQVAEVSEGVLGFF